MCVVWSLLKTSVFFPSVDSSALLLRIRRLIYLFSQMMVRPRTLEDAPCNYSSLWVYFSDDWSIPRFEKLQKNVSRPLGCMFACHSNRCLWDRALQFMFCVLVWFNMSAKLRLLKQNFIPHYLFESFRYGNLALSGSFTTVSLSKPQSAKKALSSPLKKNELFNKVWSLK